MVINRHTDQAEARRGGVTIFLMLSILVVYFITGTVLSALPIHLHVRLGQSAFIVGLVSGLQFLAALASRLWAGSYADRHGPKSAVIIGLGLAVASGALCLASLALLTTPVISVVVLAVGRAFLGGAECFVIVGAVSWSLAIVEGHATGTAIARMGMALYVGLAVGAPVGGILYDAYGFMSVGLIALALPAFALLMILPLPAITPEAQEKGGFWIVLRAVWKPGLGLAFASLGYGATMAFSILLFVERGWRPAWLSLTIFAVAFILARLFFGDLPDRIGGAKIARIFAFIQMIGLALLAFSPVMIFGYAGSALSGFGYSLVYPGLGLEAVTRAPVARRGLAIATYTAFLELTLGIASPLLGLLANSGNLASVFSVSAVCTAGTILVCRNLVSNKFARTSPTVAKHEA